MNLAKGLQLVSLSHNHLGKNAFFLQLLTSILEKGHILNFMANMQQR